MITYQFDECFNDLDVIEKCSSEKQVTALPFPARLSGTKDPEIIPEFVALGNPVVTIDGRFLDDNARHVPDAHPGIVVIRFSYRIINRQLTSSAAARILRELKTRYTNWFQKTIRNSIITVTERTIDVHHVEHGRASRDWGCRYRKLADDGDDSDWIHYELCDDQGFAQMFETIIDSNEARSAQ